jgi:hypothetical protein
MAVLGERGLFVLPYDWLLRIRYNPFYAYLEVRVLEWVDSANVSGKGSTGLLTPEGQGIGVVPPGQ